jgi:hypothetical protein
MKSSISWDITPYSPLNVNLCFGGTYVLHLQGRKIRRPRNQHKAGGKQRNLLSESSGSSETSVEFQLAIYRYILKDRSNK